MPSNPRKGTKEFAAQQKRERNQDALIKANAQKAKGTRNRFEKAAYEEASLASALLDNNVRRRRRESK